VTASRRTLVQEPSRWRYVPNALSGSRVALVAIIYVAAWRHDAALFAVLVLTAVLTDILDGPLARHFGSASKVGANIDSAADLCFYLSLPVWTWMFRPDVVYGHRHLIVALVALYVFVNFLSQAKFGALGVHNRLSRASGTVGVVGTFYVILWGIDTIVYVSIVAILCADLAQRYGALLRATMRDRRARRA
jgi:CDP-diacylglycerol--glycerol-3-phosphate 3-phosphatidyltransferase